MGARSCRNGELQSSRTRHYRLRLLFHHIARKMIIACGFLLLCCSDLHSSVGSEDSEAPSVVPIGALVSYETLIGRVARKAIQMAVEDINRDKHLLKGSKLELQMVDTYCNAFQGAAGGKSRLIVCNDLHVSPIHCSWHFQSV
jgi:hypothetical protein